MSDDARYVVRDHPTFGRRLWWAPPGGAAWDRLPLHRTDETDDVATARQVAEAILLHATGDFAAAGDHAAAFRSNALDGALARGETELRADVVLAWLTLNEIPPAPGWGPLGPAPVVECTRVGGVDRYRLSLDGWELLRIEARDGAHTVTVDVAHVDAPGARWSGLVVIAEPADDHRPVAPGGRVSAESLPFGGWAVQVDGFDVAIVERHATSATHARVAVYDRGLDSQLQRFDEAVAYREPPSERLSVADRLARFHGTPGLERVIGR